MESNSWQIQEVTTSRLIYVCWYVLECVYETVDGRNPANQLSLVVYSIKLSTGFYTFRGVQDVFHQDYDYICWYCSWRNDIRADTLARRNNMPLCIHPGRLTWNLQITHLERKMIFQTSMIMFHVNLQGCIPWVFLPDPRLKLKLIPHRSDVWWCIMTLWFLGVATICPNTFDMCIYLYTYMSHYSQQDMKQIYTPEN